MDLLNNFHFAYPLWLWAFLVIPVVIALYLLFYRRKNTSHHQLEKFIDRHLLSYLLRDGEHKKRSFFKTLLLWSAVWACLTFALAGPRWNYREIETFSKDQSLVILLDLSESMNAEDLKPTRLVRAKQKIEDLINQSVGVKIGLIAFAADPHMIAPITDDKEMIRHLLPSLETGLIYVQGSKLSPALTMASSMLGTEPGSNKAVLVISDGGFEDASAITMAKKLAESGYVIHAMGVGTVEGAPLRDAQGNILKRNGQAILSKLEQERLKGLADAGKGYYLEAKYSAQGEGVILKDLEKRSEAQVNTLKKNKLWDERFYFLLLPILPVILFWFRRGYVFSALLFLPFFSLEAASIKDSFKNSEELGKEALDSANYEAAIDSFKDPYRKGVAYYKAGKFKEAEEMFKNSTRQEVSLNAAYNLGNSLAKQEKFKEAISAYEGVLKKWPECTKAKDNLELVKNLLQKQESSNSETGEKKKEESESKDSETQEEQKNPSEENSSKEDKEQDEMAASDTDENQEEPKTDKPIASQEDQDADLWLNQISGDPKSFLKNKFYIESKKSGATKGVDPW